MLKFLRKFPSRLPAVIMMSVIFAASATPAEHIPTFDWAELLVKKGAHMLGFGLLALAFAWWFSEAALFRPRILSAAWSAASLYAVTDEFHQFFVAGRHASWADVLIDAGGAAIFLLLLRKFSDKKTGR